MKNIAALMEYVDNFGETQVQKVRFNEETSVYTMNLSQMERFKKVVDETEEVKLQVSPDDELLYRLVSGEFSVTISVDPQYHITSDKDTKVWTEKVGDKSFKLIYHRDKDGKKEYRLYMAEKVNGKLKRTRIVNDDIRKIHSNEKKFTQYFKDNILPKYQEKVG